MDKFLSIYIHYPYCKSKCPYCDFNSHVKEGINQEFFLNSYIKELDFFTNKISNRIIKSIFFGGGTPSLMQPRMIENIIDYLSKKYKFSQNIEITLEANPTSFEVNKFKAFKNAGINRVSIGVQSFNESELKFLGREHSRDEATFAITQASKIFNNFSFDLIYNLPNQDINLWKKDLEFAFSINSAHLSLYQLTIEKGTKFFSDHQKGKFIMPNEEISAEFYETTNNICKENYLNQYEISNYAKNGYESIHNTAYWNGDDYLGIGPGAHSRIYFKNDIFRSEVIITYDPDNWLNKINNKGEAILTHNYIEPDRLLEELILMALRTKNGFNNNISQKHFSLNFNDLFDMSKLEKLQKLDLINIEKNGFVINKFILANKIIEKVIDCIK